MSHYKQYHRTQIAEMADWEPGFDMTSVSVSDADKAAGSPKLGDKIARNPANHADRWLVAADYFAVNFQPVRAPAQSQEPGAMPEEEPRVRIAKFRQTVEPKRYNPDSRERGGMTEYSHGDYVTIEDYNRLRRALVAAESRADREAKLREAAEKDAERLDFVQSQTKGYGRGWIFRNSVTGRGMRLHETSQPEAKTTVREAIDAARSGSAKEGR